MDQRAQGGGERGNPGPPGVEESRADQEVLGPLVASLARADSADFPIQVGGDFVLALARRGDATFDMVYLGSTPDRLCEDLVGSWMALTASVARVEGIHPSIRAMLKSLSETVRHEVSAR